MPHLLLGKSTSLIGLSMVLILIFSLSFFSCRKEKARPAFEMRYFIDFEVSAGANLFTYHQYPVQKIPTGIDFFLEQNNIEAGDIITVNTSFARLGTVFDNENLSIIDEIIIDLFIPTDQSINYEAAYTLQIPIRSQNRIQLVPSITNLRDVLIAEEFDLVPNIRFRGIPPRNFTAQLEIAFEVFRE
ncbi:MAG: hypothetical protein EA362_02780 [Saprospirales bacterium]|nr:MAG: hypothetical protein EA362_02780 [Saprospirales bacterium]